MKLGSNLPTYAVEVTHINGVAVEALRTARKKLQEAEEPYFQNNIITKGS